MLVFTLALTGCKDNKDNAVLHLAKARDLAATHDLAGALVEAKAAIQADPRSKEAHALAADMAEQTGDMQTAFVEYVRTDALDPGDHRARFKTIDMLIAAGELDAALGRINATLGDDPGSIDALALRAFVEARQGVSQKARTDVANVVAKAPGNVMAAAALGELALRDGKADVALAAIGRGLATAPTNRTLLELQARADLVGNDPLAAIAVFQRLLALDPASVAYRQALAGVQATAVSVATGAKTLADGVAAMPRSQAMRLQLVAYLLRSGDPAAADAALRDAIKATPDDSAFDLLLAGQQAQRGHLDDAVGTVKAALSRLPEGPSRTRADIGLARLTVAKGDAAGAQDILNAVLKADPANDDALMTRAELSIQGGAFTSAITDLLSVAKRQPTNVTPYEMLARTYLRLHQQDDAIDALRRIADLKPADPAAALQLADLCAQLGRPHDAQAAIGDFVRRNPGSIEGRVALVRFDLSQNDVTTAQADLDHLRQLPGTETITLALGGKIKEARGQPAEAAAAYRQLLGQGIEADLAQAFAHTSLAAGKGQDAVAFLEPLRAGAVPAQAAAVERALASLYGGLGQAGKADAAIDAAIRLTPTDPAAYLQGASEPWRQGRQGDAVALLQRGLAAGATRTPLLFALAIAQAEAGRTDDAIASYRTLLAEDPGSLPAANNLTALLADRKPLDTAALMQARDRLESLVVVDNVPLADTIAWANYRLGDYASAKSLLDRVKAGASDRPEIRFHYGAVLIASGERDAGRSLIQAAVNQNFSGKAEAETLLTQ